MKKILFILSVLITSLSFASPKDWIDENKVKKAGYYGNSNPHKIK